MSAVMVIVSVLAIIVGFLLSSQATTGVVIIGIACWAGIMARIIQASGQHNFLIKHLEYLEKQNKLP
jgi:hypothetical protein